MKTLCTPLDVLVFIFLLSGLIGYWASYDPAASLPKLLMLIGAVVVYYSVIALRFAPRLFSLALWLYILGGAGASSYFIAQTNFAVAPTKLELLTHLGASLNAILPHLVMPAPHPNLAAGALEFVLPFACFAAIHSAKQHAWFEVIVAAVCSLVILLGLLLTTSRGAWIAIAIVVGGIVPGYGASVIVRRRQLSRREQLLCGAAALAILISTAAVFGLTNQFANIWNAIRSNQAAASRLELYTQAWELIQEYPFTGAGLGVFPLVYSAYVMLIDAPLLPHAHNIFLAIWSEQGILGVVALIWLIVAFAIWGWRNRHSFTWIAMASFIAVGIWLVHGLIDIPIYGSHALPLLFVPFAFAIVSVGNRTEPSPKTSPYKKTSSRIQYKWVVVALLVIGVLLTGWKEVVSTFYANLGTITQTKAELALYHLNKPPIEIRSIVEIRRTLTTPFDTMEQYYLTALRYDPSNQVAHRRLGLIALARRDMSSAVGHLAMAWQAHPSSRATIKALGYAYGWSGDSAKAAALLEPLPETRLELWDDTWWWRLQGRPDLAYQAAKIFYLSLATQPWRLWQE